MPPARPLCHGPDPPQFSRAVLVLGLGLKQSAVRGLGLGPLARSFPPTMAGRDVLFLFLDFRQARNNRDGARAQRRERTSESESDRERERRVAARGPQLQRLTRITKAPKSNGFKRLMANRESGIKSDLLTTRPTHALSLSLALSVIFSAGTGGN